MTESTTYCDKCKQVIKGRVWKLYCQYSYSDSPFGHMKYDCIDMCKKCYKELLISCNQDTSFLERT